jgi:alkyl hydroperoxide reductase subunit D
MSIENLKDQLPEYAKDLKLNLSSLLNNTDLNEQQLWGALLAAAIASQHATVMKAIATEAQQHLSPEALQAAKAAAAIMAMNNIYYRFVHLASNKEYGKLQAGLRMNIIGNPGVDKTDFELWSLVVSAVNGCGMCIDSHEKQLLKNGVNMASIQAAVRIASVVHAVAVTIASEEMLTS